MKFIHAADLHLDTPFVNVKSFSKQLQNNLQKSTYTAATKVFDTAIRERVDFVILAGDTYDNTQRSLNAQAFLKNQFTRLKENNIQVYLIYGNHDYYRNNFSVIEFPANVHIFPETVSTETLTSRDGLKVGITGFSYHQQHISDDMAQNYPMREAFDYQIGILHGSVGSGEYAPFMVNELISKGYDYWALGHIHKREVINENPDVIYSGDTQGRNPNETGEKGFYLVTVLNQRTTLDFIASSSYVWTKQTIDAVSDDNLDSLINKATKFLDTETPELISFTINNAQRLDPEIIRAIQRDELLTYFSHQTLNGVMYQLTLEFKQEQRLQNIDQKYWDESAEQVFDLNDIKEMDQKLYNIDLIREHLNDPEFIQSIKAATQNIINQKHIGEES
ncbi:metallophosphoesterase family protein [Companilactobacillus sp.]|jgi:DNA repair exonuclease SbcCD nuclease subunit|uniref:metallophosphoesterase family protein n=1 Tax=Companilactobacillus sp. TaxID=2767905 RepID=UPI0025BE1C62|nr:exonuclease SbcCD subunit D [Companilactobacillus sp.]MCH4007960.1 exonuclease SbcCD subunit D [Companilactobacillus sp.]MCH4051861.1 exonuclease SbcCD subunit D [Companilactobacillus sp.]MCH4075903.1 exonuclease SbcCD subunit D [Companilactobacillus sp.]MCH4124478.1 exonuclease SbcCD subunit D [Companilactobacillus sp.]MCH4132559.1 exonuclease SbcCD subunit D [Companilactobacillus sp.]